MGHKYTKIAGTEPPKDPCLYLGSIDWIIEDNILDELHIGAILSVLPRQPNYAEEVLKSHNIPEEDYMVYPLEDSSEEYISLFESPGVVAATDFIHLKRLEGKTVLVHCDAGITRSPAVVVSYLMKYGGQLHAPSRLTLEAAMAHVRGLRERMDICAFHAELVQLEKQLGQNEVLCSPIDRAANMSFPRTPMSPKKWDDLKEEGDPYVELSVLHATWRAIRGLEGGQAAFGMAVYSNLFRVGGQRMEDLFAEVDLPRQSKMMAQMLHQILWCLDDRNLEKLVKFHRDIDVKTSDFQSFKTAIICALRDKLQMPDSTVQSWDKFLLVVFNRWARAIDLELLPPSITTPVLPTGVGCPFAGAANAAAGAAGCPFAGKGGLKSLTLPTRPAQPPSAPTPPPP